MYANRQNFRVFRKLGSRNTMVTSDFRPEVEIRPFRACAMKNAQYNPYLWPNRRNFRVFQEIRVEEHHPVSVTKTCQRLYNSVLRMRCACSIDRSPMKLLLFHLTIIRTARSLWTWLWGRYHVPQNVFLVSSQQTSSIFFLVVLARTHAWSAFFHSFILSILPSRRCVQQCDMATDRRK